MISHLLDFLIFFFLSFIFTQGHYYVRASTFSHKIYPFYFVFILAYLLISLSIQEKPKAKKILGKAKLLIFWSVVLITVGKSFYTAIHLRYTVSDYPSHDGAIQIEEAIKFFLAGKNPYTENYHGTPLQDWYVEKESSVLYHLVTPPFFFLFSLLVSIPSKAIFGYYDQRMTHMFVFLISFYLLWKLIKPVSRKIIYLSLFVFNPLFIHFFIEGRNDIFVFTWLLISLLLLYQKKILLSSFFLGITFASKQSSWLILPFYFFYIFWQQKKNPSFIKKAKLVLKNTWGFFITVIAIFLPFLIWDAKSFIEDIYLFAEGRLPTSFPIWGAGFSQFLPVLNIRDRHSYFPFWIFQFSFGVPLLFYLLIKFKKNQKISFLLTSYAIFLFVFWLFSRFFNDNYLGYLAMIFLLALIFKDKETAASA